MTKRLAIVLLVCLAVALFLLTWYGIPGWTWISIAVILGMGALIKNYKQYP